MTFNFPLKKQISNWWLQVAMPVLTDTRLWVIKFFILCHLLLIVVMPSFLIRQGVLNNTISHVEPTNGSGFIFITHIINKGIAFGSLDGRTGLVYFLQITPTVVCLICMIFSKRWYIYLSLGLVALGGLCNVLDRAIPDTFASDHPKFPGQTFTNGVVDYFSFGFTEAGGIFNLPDVYVIAGAILLAIGLVGSTMVTEREEKRRKDAALKEKLLKSREVQIQA